MSTINVVSKWDAEAEVWVATSPEIPGLILEAETAEGIVEEAQRMISQLLQLRRDAGVQGPYSCKITSEREFEIA